MNHVAVHIHAPRPTMKSVHTTVCPDCKQRTRMLMWFTPYYGWDSTCIKCGREWQDGEWMDLPFIRQSRQKNIERAKARFRRICPLTTPED